MTTAANDCERRFLLLAPTGRDARIALRFLHEAGLEAMVCRDLATLIAASREGAAGLFIAEEALGRDATAALAAMLAEQGSWSDLPIIVFTTTGADQAVIGSRHARLLPELGNVTLLDRPLRPIALISAARSALRARLRQYETRETLAQQALAVQHRDQFLAMLGHELRNPLSAIQLAAESARDDVGDRRVVQIIRRQTEHLARLVDDLLDVSRVTSGKLVLHRRPADLRTVVERGIAALEPESRRRKLTLEVTLPDQPVPVDIDVVRIEQVLANLITNAIKYTPAGGHLKVAVETTGDSALVTVADSGAGIAPDMIERVFDLFTQVDATLERSRGGLGIGLTLVRRIIQMHGGEVEARSDGLGLGSTFTARLPLCAEETRDLTTLPRAVAVAPDGAPIVLVEDHDDSRELLREMLQTHGHRVTATASGVAGVQAAIAEQPAIMIIDIGLPELDGYSVARRVREALGAAVFLIALTGYGQPDDRRRAVEAGFDVHVTKPVNSSTLLDLLAQRVPAARAHAGG